MDPTPLILARFDRIEKQLENIDPRLRAIEEKLTTHIALHSQTLQRLEKVEVVAEDARFAKRLAVLMAAGFPTVFGVLKSMGWV